MMNILEKVLLQFEQW